MDTTPADGVKKVKDSSLEGTEEDLLLPPKVERKGGKLKKNSKQEPKGGGEKKKKIVKKVKYRLKKKKGKKLGPVLVEGGGRNETPTPVQLNVSGSVKSVKSVRPNESKKQVKTKSGQGIVPLGFILIPRDSEPTLDSIFKITWVQCCSLRGWSSVIFFESCLAYIFFPMNLTLGLVALIWNLRETEELRSVFKNYSPMSLGLLTDLVGGTTILLAILIIVGTYFRRGCFIIISIFVILLDMVLVGLFCSFIMIHASEVEIRQYLRELLDSYKMVGQEAFTLITDHVQKHFHCCGIEEPMTWLTRVRRQRSNSTYLPPTCCQNFLSGDGLGMNMTSRCYLVTDKMDMMYWFYHKEGCLKKLQQYLQYHYNMPWLYTLTLLTILFLTLIFCIIYLIRMYATLLQHVHPRIRTLVDEVVEKAEDEIFAIGIDKHEQFDEDVKDYIRQNLNKCHTIDEVQQFLSMTADVQTYIRNLEPEAFARDILSRNEELLQKFEAVLGKLTAKLATTDKKEVKIYNDLIRAKSNWQHVKKRIMNMRQVEHK